MKGRKFNCLKIRELVSGKKKKDSKIILKDMPLMLIILSPAKVDQIEAITICYVCHYQCHSFRNCLSKVRVRNKVKYCNGKVRGK